MFQLNNVYAAIIMLLEVSSTLSPAIFPPPSSVSKHGRWVAGRRPGRGVAPGLEVQRRVRVAARAGGDGHNPVRVCQPEPAILFCQVPSQPSAVKAGEERPSKK